MKYDGKIDIATGLSAKSKVWKNKAMLWSEFANKLKNVTVTRELRP